MKTGLNVEYRVREIKRYTVTRHESHLDEKGESVCGSNRMIGSEYDNFDTAHAVAYALAAKEHSDLGYGIGDERIKYPASALSENCVKAGTLET